MPAATDGLHQSTTRLVTLHAPVIVSSESVASPALSPSRLAFRLTIVLVAIGIVLRVLTFLSQRCLWIDEAMLALNIVERNPRGLLEPLDWNQGAPVGFLLSVKACVVILGATEWSLRLVPFLSSIAGLLGFTCLSRRLLPSGAAVLAVALFSLSPHLISYSAECKQYATDAAVSVGLLLASVELLKGSGGRTRWVAVAVGGVAAVWFSHPTVFTLAAIGVALSVEAYRKKQWRRLGICTAIIGCWCVSFGVCYAVTLKHLGANKYLMDYWAGHFLPLPPTSAGDLAWCADHYFGFFHDPGGLGGTVIRSGGIAAVLGIVGIVGFWRDRWPVALALFLPLSFVFLASGVHLYPFAGRLLLFLVPGAVLVVARGAWVIVEATRPSDRLIPALLIAVLVGASGLETLQQMRQPARSEELRPVLSEVVAQWQPGDKVYLYHGAVPAFNYYTRERPFPPGVTSGGDHRETRTGYREELRRFAGEKRVWLVFSHRREGEESLIRAYADGFGECSHQFRNPGAAAFLYDFSGVR